MVFGGSHFFFFGRFLLGLVCAAVFNLPPPRHPSCFATFFFLLFLTLEKSILIIEMSLDNVSNILTFTYLAKMPFISLLFHSSLSWSTISCHFTPHLIFFWCVVFPTLPFLSFRIHHTHLQLLTYCFRLLISTFTNLSFFPQSRDEYVGVWFPLL